jgi:DUF1680 family protein
VKWPEKGVRLVQETAFPEQEGAAFRIETERPSSWTLRLRVPWWATRGGRVRVNGEALPAFSSPSSYLALTRTWKSGDRVELELPMSLSVAPMPDDPTVLAAMYGPLVLAGRLGSEKLTRNMTYGEYDCELKGEPVAVDAIAGDLHDVSSWIEPAARRRLAFRTRGQAKELELVPLNRLFGERYAVYWKVRPTRA